MVTYLFTPLSLSLSELYWRYAQPLLIVSTQVCRFLRLSHVFPEVLPHLPTTLPRLVQHDPTWLIISTTYIDRVFLCIFSKLTRSADLTRNSGRFFEFPKACQDSLRVKTSPDTSPISDSFCVAGALMIRRRRTALARKQLADPADPAKFCQKPLLGSFLRASCDFLPAIRTAARAFSVGLDRIQRWTQRPCAGFDRSVWQLPSCRRSLSSHRDLPAEIGSAPTPATHHAWTAEH